MKHLWNRFLIILHLRHDWENETQITPPAFENVKPHAYDPEMDGETLTFCAQCGGGPKHRIHLRANGSERLAVKPIRQAAEAPVEYPPEGTY